MSARSKARPVISLSLLGCSLWPSLDDKATFLEVRFKCDFAEDAKPVKGTSISIDQGSLLTVVQHAESVYSPMRKLLQTQQRKAKAEAQE